MLILIEISNPVSETNPTNNLHKIKDMKKLIHKILHYRKTAVNKIFADTIITEEWILFGKFTICKTLRTV